MFSIKKLIRLGALFLVMLSVVCSILSAGEFTISSYNCGGLSDHYDYLRAAAMQKLMQERYIAEPEEMALNEKIQQVALKILFSPDPSAAKLEWEEKGYQQRIADLTASLLREDSPNTIWNQKGDGMITSYKVRPVEIYDKEVYQMITTHVNDLVRGKVSMPQKLQKARAIMAKRTFTHYLPHDIICVQEADYLQADTFPEHYEVAMSESAHSKNGIAWNKNRFEQVSQSRDILGRAFAVKLRDKESGKTVLVASGHITGCNPFWVESDSAKGDNELRTIVDLFENMSGDMAIIGMDSNVTALHPRLRILKEAGYRVDYENYLEPTCTSPYLVVNTRIDWIALKTKGGGEASITNIPIHSVGLNSIQTNISDHKPIAAKVFF